MTNPADKLVGADLTRLELLVLAHEANSAPTDLHRQRASKIFGVKPDDVTDEQRRFAKVINFGIVYTPTRNSVKALNNRLRQLFEAEQAIESARQRAVKERRDIDLPAINGMSIRLEYNPRLVTVTHCYYTVESDGRHKLIRRKYSDMLRDMRDEFLKA